VAGVVVAGTLFTGCATTVDGSSGVDSRDVRAYQSDVSVAAEQSRIAESSRAAEAARTLTVGLCAQFTTTVVTMLNGYNQFVTKLNEVQSYSEMGDSSRVLIDQLTAGEQAITAKLVGGVERPVQILVRNFLDRNRELVTAVRNEYRSGLNDPADKWIDARNKAVDACGKVAG
jgi:hypothetical protein